jgi:hypothetical protein
VANKALTAAQEKQALSRWSARLSKEINSTHLGFRPQNPQNFLFRSPPAPGKPSTPSKPAMPAKPPASAPVPAVPAPPSA